MSNPWHPNVRGVKRREIEQLFPGWKLALHRIVLAPRISKFVTPFPRCCVAFCRRSRLFVAIISA
jgi:hypothetical protein